MQITINERRAAMVCMFVSSQNSYIEVLIPNVMAFEVGPLLVLLRNRSKRACSPLPPCDDTAKRQLSMNQDAAPYQTPNLPASRAMKNKCLLFLSHSVYGIFVIAAQMV